MTNISSGAHVTNLGIAPHARAAARGLWQLAIARRRLARSGSPGLQSALLTLALVGSISGCGYEPVYAGERPSVRLSVRAAPHAPPHIEVVQAAISGMRRSLSSAGVLRAGHGYPLVVVEVVRVDEQAAGVHAVETPDGLRPLGRGALVGVVGRAWVEEVKGGVRTRQTGEVRRTKSVASASDPLEERSRHAAVLRAAGHDLGRSLGRRILGEPEVTYEPM